jgi:anti-sigma factor ChrR (cupin superfamily)
VKLTNLSELTAAYALGVLEPDEAAWMYQIIAHDRPIQEDTAGYIEAAAALAAYRSPRISPAPQLRTTILERISNTRQTVPAYSGSTEPAPGFCFQSPGENGWKPGPMPGTRFKVLSVSRDMGYWMLLADLQPGGRIPTHDHAGSEQVYVLSGDLLTEGRTLGPGDFLHAEPGTHHHELVSPRGCMALLIEKAPPEVLAKK